jgi:ATP-dependent Clp protease ATP-binding subunit ClpB
VVDFKNTIILMTSNIGSDLLAQGLKGKELEVARDAVLRRHFRPEFLNRLDGILNFHQLRREDMLQILEIQLGRVAKRLADRDLELEVTPAAKALLSDRGYDPAFGARPLKRLVQQSLLDPLATEILSGKLRAGHKVIADAVPDSAGDLQIVLRQAPAAS